MDHNAYENEMIDTINRHAEEKSRQATAVKRVFTKTDTRTLRQGLKRTLIAILTAVLFALSVYNFIAVATATGYWAVILFFSAIVLLVWAFILLYAQGITHVESKGDNK
jgi:fatty acid desaturase